jgi:hypothetical protein
MKLVCKIACLALLMNTLPGLCQERVFYKTVQVNGLNTWTDEFYFLNQPGQVAIQTGCFLNPKT